MSTLHRKKLMEHNDLHERQAGAPESHLASGRRAFIKQSLMGVSTVTLGFYLPSAASAPAVGTEPNTALRPNAWVEIPPQGRIRFICARTEMGQGSSTGLAMLLCEEMEIALQDIELVIAPASRAYDHVEYLLQTTGGSSSIRTEFTLMLQAGASVRELFKMAAAQRWQVRAEEVRVANGLFSHPTVAQPLSYNALVTQARGLSLPKVAVRERSQWRLVGTRVPRLDNRIKATGAPIYGIDASPPGVVCAWVMHGPHQSGRANVSNQKELLDMPGVLQVVVISRGVAVIAQKYWQAKAAGEKLKVAWEDDPAAAPFSSAEHLRQSLEQTKSYAGSNVASKGKVVLPANALEVVYELPYLAHATLEPQNCTVQLSSEACEVWVPTQSPGLVVPVVKQLTGLAADRIKVNCTYLGGGFGRRLEADFVVEAVEIARAFKGRQPVKMLWDRETDMRAGMYRPCAVARIRGSYDKASKQLHWQQVIATQSIMERQGPDFMQGIAPHWVSAGTSRGIGAMVSWFIDGLTIKEGVLPPYRMVGVDINWQKTRAPVSVASWRSVGHSHNAFFIESFADELAHSQQQDPMAFRLQMLGDDQLRLRETLQAVATACQWQAGPPPGRFRGVAAHESFKGFAAMVVEVSVDAGSAAGVRVHQVWCAIDCGLPVNPDGIAQQLEGSVIFGLTAALYGEITFDKGAVQQSNFHDYPLLRNNEAPLVHTVIVPSTQKPGGVGEPAVTLVAPALANAIFAARGERLRRLPLAKAAT
jgi:isoquinoline 1-oxidoreductase subunit beta